MPVYDYVCKSCNKEFEKIGTIQEASGTRCPACGSCAGRIYRPSGTNMANQDASWIRSVVEVADYDSKAPHVREFIKNPTRETYKTWMKGEGLRHREPGEKAVKETLDIKRHTDLVMKRKKQRERIELYER